MMSPRPFGRKAFTLVELLTVIAIIAVLMGLLFPAVNSVRTSARNAQAKNDLVNLVTAIRAYYTEYGKYPGTEESGRYETPAAQAALVKILRGLDDTNNRRRIVFLEVPEAKNPNNPVSGIHPTTEAWMDPWGGETGFYRVRIDAESGAEGYNNEVENPYTANAGPEKLRSPVIAYCLGKDGKGGAGDKNAGDAKDDVLSWQ
jgi:prepilin-type N-terminal cleavage/methylation domain-containing protein